MKNNFYPLYGQGVLDPQAEEVLRLIEKAGGVPLTAQTLQEARANFLEKAWIGEADKSIRIKNKIVDNSARQVPLRVYTPEGNGSFPILIFFHGGGFVLGALDEFDPFCSMIAAKSSCIVVSVGYSLAPENKYPAAVNDAISAYNWICLNASEIQGDAARIAVAGDSAGGNLAVVTSMTARKSHFPPLLCQILICPWIDLSSTDTNSYKCFGEGLWLSTANICWYRNHYLQSAGEASNELVSPLLAKNITGLPPTLIIAAEYDVLVDEGNAYAKCLIGEDVPVKYSLYYGMLHDFVVLPGLFDKAKDAINEICAELKSVFNK